MESAGEGTPVMEVKERVQEHAGIRLSMPQEYDGSAANCQGFLLQLNLYLATVHPAPSDCERVSALLTCLTGKALEALIDHYSLREDVRRELACRDATLTFDQLVDLSIWLDNLLATRERPDRATVIESMHGARFFTKLDLRGAYNLVCIREGDEWKTAFSTTSGHYEYFVMPYGFMNAPSVFQAFVDKIIRDLHGQGYRISTSGVEIESDHIAAVRNWPNPTTVKVVQRFLGLDVWARIKIKAPYVPLSLCRQLLNQEQTLNIHRTNTPVTNILFGVRNCVVDSSLTVPMALLKSGWLWRQTSILKHWKLNWCDLWIDGTLAFYKTDSRREFEHRVGLKTSCVSVKSGLECAGISPPENHPRENLVVVQLRDSTTVILCANSEDEALAWKLTILEVRRNPFVYDPYNDSYPSVPMDGHNTIYLAPGSGTHHILIQRDPYDGIGEQVALGLLAGMAAGAAMRSFLWMPFFFC
ncbi:uncharacterized protein LOC118390961 [Oncorhynchus keta]|uniref:uncharacterized protein LOC118390961 n=1 Tax=Oncorhynchus keta TaxID=8018 RepID=UPI00227D3CC4|nr:uncharacterized protein LOC118390961 [Oncorhynchus keta]